MLAFFPLIHHILETSSLCRRREKFLSDLPERHPYEILMPGSYNLSVLIGPSCCSDILPLCSQMSEIRVCHFCVPFFVELLYSTLSTLRPALGRIETLWKSHSIWHG
jgi:hypothetical protein